jgi:predicted pyridoxine 5'-phosphate oxidase superfamily flavin-nucleotide-binding protein
MYHEGNRRLQKLFDSERLADRIEAKFVQTELDESDKALIESQFMFFIATADAEGRPNCSYKGGDRGFVRVLDPKTIVFPDYNGNGMYLTLGNLAIHPSVGLLFIDFEKQTRFRVNGEATIDLNDSLLAQYPGAQLIIRVSVREAFPNCPRYIPKMKVEEPSRFVPKAGIKAPIPEWKQSEWARDVLPADDPANGSEAPRAEQGDR